MTCLTFNNIRLNFCHIYPKMVYNFTQTMEQMKVTSRHQNISTTKNERIQRSTPPTLRISGERELGPLEEKIATTGAGDFLITVMLGDICTAACLLLYCITNYKGIVLQPSIVQRYHSQFIINRGVILIYHLLGT